MPTSQKMPMARVGAFLNAYNVSSFPSSGCTETPSTAHRPAESFHATFAAYQLGAVKYSYETFV